MSTPEMSLSCIFCEIVKESAPSKTIFENNDCLAIVPLKPEANGHLLVIPKHHVIEIEDIPSDLLFEITSISPAKL